MLLGVKGCSPVPSPQMKAALLMAVSVLLGRLATPGAQPLPGDVL